MQPLPRPLVLVVDDDERNRALVRAVLEETHEILEAADGPGGLALCEHRDVDLVLLDVMMPGLDGFEVCRRLKARTDRRFRPVLLLTALSEQPDRNQGLAAGADDFLSKPIDRHELQLRVKHFLELRGQRDLVLRQFEEMRQLDALKDDLVSLMVHDLRNPLAGIAATLHLLQGSRDASIQEDVRFAMAATKRLQEILDDMLQVRMLEEGQLRLSRTTTQIERLLEDALVSMEATAKLRRIDLIRDAAPGLEAPVDVPLVRRAIENLLANAIKFSPTGSRVEIRTRAEVDAAVVEIADRGDGVGEHARQDLFQKFGGLRGRTSDRKGTGLGLYFVRLVAEAHGGAVAVANRPEGGALFRLWLPFNGSHAAA